VHSTLRLRKENGGEASFTSSSLRFLACKMKLSQLNELYT